MCQIKREVVLPASSERVWGFLATPVNLDLLTPPELRFRIITEVPEHMHEGLRILYNIEIPFFGRRKWLTEIREIVPGQSFVDEQLRGPYRSWIHYHLIDPLPDGRTRMTDRVDYRLPFGALGRLVHWLIVRRMLGRIFDYREQKLLELFPADCARN